MYKFLLREPRFAKLSAAVLLGASLSACGNTQPQTPQLKVDAGAVLQSQVIGAGTNFLSDQTPVLQTNGYGPYEKNRSNGEAGANDGRTLTLAGVTYPYGLGVHANSDLTYDIGAQCRGFTTSIGVDDEVGASGSVVFQVYADGFKVYQSALMTGNSATVPLSIDTRGVEKLRLVVTDGGNGSTSDHADWADAKLLNCVTYSAPLTITKGGVYTGNWKSNNPAVPAVTVATQEAVTIQNSTISSRGNAIDWTKSQTDVKIKNNYIYGLNPNADGQPKGQALKLQSPVNLEFEHNAIIGMGGVLVNDFQGRSDGTGVLRVRYNYAKNIDGRVSSGIGTYRNNANPKNGDHPDGGFIVANFFQLDNTSSKAGIEISWNEVFNEPGNSAVEDNINIHSSSGTASSPINIHENLIQGGYSNLPELNYNYSGGGILLGDGCGSSYQKAFYNTVINTTNYGIAIAGGHDQLVSTNFIYGDAKIINQDGTTTYLDSNNDAGIYVRNYCTTKYLNPTEYLSSTNSADSSYYLADLNKLLNNTVGWGVPESGNPSARSDISIGSVKYTRGGTNQPALTAANNTNTTQYNGGVGALPAGVISTAISNWRSHAAANGVVTGP